MLKPHLAVPFLLPLLTCCGPHKVPAPKPVVAATPRVDVMLVVDVTGSTGTPRYLQDALQPLANTLKTAGVDARFGITIFRDEKPTRDLALGVKDDPWTFPFSDGEYYTDNIEAIRKIVFRLNDEGGGDTPENALEALKLASSKASRKDAVKVLVLMTDGPPRPWPDYKASVLETRKHLMDQDVRQLHLLTHKDVKGPFSELWDRRLSKSRSGVEVEALAGGHQDFFDAMSRSESIRVQAVRLGQDITTRIRQEMRLDKRRDE